MTDVVGVVFEPGGKVYYFDPGNMSLGKGEQVVVQTAQGNEMGQVVQPPHEVSSEEIHAPLKRVVRPADAEDLRIAAENERLKESFLQTCRELIEKHGLDMKLIDAEIAFEGGKVTFHFYADERVDFRALVAELARTLKRRIELRQIGAREEARLIGGMGPCGRKLCCCSFGVSQDPVSIRMAKEQQLPLNPSKISGLCGRLMCCLKYEQDQYVEFRKTAPRCGTRVETSAGPGTVVAHKVPKAAVAVRFEDGETADFPVVTCNCGDKPCLVVERCVAEEGPWPAEGEEALTDEGSSSGACDQPLWEQDPEARRDDLGNLEDGPADGVTDTEDEEHGKLASAEDKTHGRSAAAGPEGEGDGEKREKQAQNPDEQGGAAQSEGRNRRGRGGRSRRRRKPRPPRPKE